MKPHPSAPTAPKPCPPCFFFLVALLFFSACSEPQGAFREGFEAGRYRTIVAFGDSIVEGYHQPEGWPEILGHDLDTRFPGITMINAGVSGDTADDGLRRLEGAVLKHDPDLVLIAFGLNDMKNGRSVKSFTQDVDSMIERIRQAGAQPVLLTTTRLQKGAGLLARLDPAPFNEAVRKLSRDKRVPLLDVNAGSEGLDTPEFLMDGAHPNAEGYRRLAGIIREGLVGE